MARTLQYACSPKKSNILDDSDVVMLTGQTFNDRIVLRK